MKFARSAVIYCLFSILIAFPFQSKGIEKSGKCRIPNIEEAYQGSKAVFVGEITKVVEDGDVKTFTFKVEKYWKGAANREIEINVRQTMRYQAWFETGETYLVFARGEREKDEKLWETRCSRSKRLAEASEDIAELGRAKTPVKK